MSSKFGGVNVKSSELKVVGLSITEDFYCYKGTFMLYGKEDYIFVDLAEFDDAMLNKIKNKFGIDETPDEIREVIMSKLIEASKLECRNVQGKA